MGSEKQTGFTVIEILLFLGITGMLVVGILVGSGVAISQQRYRDSVNSLKSYLQLQYSEVGNVINSRGKAWTCDSNGTIISSDDTSGEARGTSECVLLGRFITIDDTGTKLTSADAVGYRTPGAPVAASDIAELSTNYKISASPIDQDSQEVSWGAQVVKQKTTTPMPISMLILRSPLGGSVYTFVKEGPASDPGSLITAANTTTTHDLCVNADVGTFVGRRMEVRIASYASSQNAVLVPTESESVCD